MVSLISDHERDMVRFHLILEVNPLYSLSTYDIAHASLPVPRAPHAYAPSISIINIDLCSDGNRTRCMTMKHSYRTYEQAPLHEQEISGLLHGRDASPILARHLNTMLHNIFHSTQLTSKYVFDIDRRFP